MPNQILRGLIFIILVFLVTSDLKEIITTLTTSSSITAFLQRQHSAQQQSSHHHQQRVKRQAGSGSGSHNIGDSAPIDEGDQDLGGPYPTGAGTLNYGASGDSAEHLSHEEGDDIVAHPDTLQDPMKQLNERGQNSYTKRKVMKLNAQEKKELLAMKTQLTAVMQEWCLPKLVCELHASVTERGSLTDAEKGLLSLIRETSLGTMGEVVSRYHFAAHMGQLISGVEGNGCHNFYPNCPLSGSRVLQMMKKVRIR